MSSILLKNGLLATFTTGDASASKPKAYRADVLIAGSKIIRIAPGNTLKVTSEIIDCSNKWIAPGFVDTHRHLWTSVSQGQEDWTIGEYIAKCTFTEAEKVDADDIYIGQLAGALQALHGGTTTVVDHFSCPSSSEHITKAITATIESRIRCMFCLSRQSLATSIEPIQFGRDKEMSEMQVSIMTSLAQRDHGRLTADGRVTLGLAYDVLGFDPAEDSRIINLARSLNVTPITAHFVGGPQAPGYGKRAHSWHSAGLLLDDVIFSHGNGLVHQDCDEEEWEILKKTGASVSSTPVIELSMGQGNPVAFDAARRGLKVGLGVDCMSFLSADMFPVMHSILQFERGRVHAEHAHAKVPNAVKYNTVSCVSAFRMATLGGAEAAHAADRIGSIEEGKFADIVLYDADSINLAGCSDPFTGITMHATAQDVDTVIVNGSIVKKGGKLVSVVTSEGELGWKEIGKSLRQHVEKIKKRLEGIDMEKRLDIVQSGMGINVVEA